MGIQIFQRLAVQMKKNKAKKNRYKLPTGMPIRRVKYRLKIKCQAFVKQGHPYVSKHCSLIQQEVCYKNKTIGTDKYVCDVCSVENFTKMKDVKKMEKKIKKKCEFVASGFY